MSLSRVCFVLLVASHSAAEAAGWAKTPEGLAAGVVMGVAKGPRQTEGDAPWPASKANQEEKRFARGSHSFRDKRQASRRRPRPCCGSVTPQKESVPTRTC
nr:uncharacterized protein LOC113830562 [Penaeus vannamei]